MAVELVNTAIIARRSGRNFTFIDLALEDFGGFAVLDVGFPPARGRRRFARAVGGRIKDIKIRVVRDIRILLDMLRNMI